MAFNFWKAQDTAKRQTRIYVTMFIALAIAGAALVEIILRSALEDDYGGPIPVGGAVFLLLTGG